MEKPEVRERGACGETAGQCRSDVFCHAVLFGAESGRLFQNATPSHIPVTLPSGTQGPEEVRGAMTRMTGMTSF